MKPKLEKIKAEKDEQKLIRLRKDILMFGLNSEPTSANVVAKRLHLKENSKNIAAIKTILENLVHEHKVYRSGSRYAIDFRGGLDLMKSFCIKISKENYKIDNYVFENISSQHP